MPADGCKHYANNKIMKSDYSRNCPSARTILVMVGIIYEKLVVADHSMKWNEMKWNEMKWNEMKWNEMKWNMSADMSSCEQE